MRARTALRVAASTVSHLSLAVPVAAAALVLAVRATPLPPVERARALSPLVLARTGEILWAFQTEAGRWRLPVDLGVVDPAYLALLLATEDRRFRSHPGVDPLAILRAGWQAVLHRRPVSGASTLTMQVVRLLQPRPRTLASKLGEMLGALRLERSLSKDQILGLYLTLAPYGGNLEGVRAASLMLLGKEPRRLTAAESALLVAIPQAPEARRPDRHPEAALAARARVLPAAATAPLPTSLHPLTRAAPHLAMRLRPADPATPVTSLVDPALQAHVEAVAANALRGWGPGVSVAAIVIRNRDAAVAAYLGGPDLLSEDRRGFVDLVQAVRSPGSALKPFVYGMAFERLAVHPETIIADRPLDIEGYRPENADGAFAGDLSVRQALIRSRNTTAVQLLDRIGVPAFLARFRSAGRPLALPEAESAAGLAVALGGVGVSLEQLAWFYSAIPAGGRLHRLRWTTRDEPAPVGELLTPAAAGALADILGDVPPPPGFAKPKAGDGGRRIGFKTGTSYGFRDAWAVGFDRLHTVGIWVGRADGAAHLGAYGATAAAPLMLRIFDRLPVPDRDIGPSGTEAASLAAVRDLPDRLRRFRPAGQDSAAARRPLEIVFPKPGAELEVDRAGRTGASLPLTLAGGRGPYRWVLNGAEQPPTAGATLVSPVEARGQLEVSVTDASGTVARSSFWLR